MKRYAVIAGNDLLYTSDSRKDAIRDARIAALFLGEDIEVRRLNIFGDGYDEISATILPDESLPATRRSNL